MSRSFGGEFTPPAGRREKRRVANVQSAIRALTLRHNVEVFPAMSDHFKGGESARVEIQAQSLTFTQPEGSFGWLDRPDEILERLNAPDDVA